MTPDAAARYPKAARLRRRAEFVTLQRSGQRWHSRSFVVIWRPSPTGCTRLGVTVSRRVGKAVVRNRVKRLVREVFRIDGRDLSPAQDILVIARAGAHKLQYAQVASELGRVFRSPGSSG
jgi:ribonuclease P protein component